MSLWTSLEPASATVDPGGSTAVRLRLRNTGDVVDEYSFEPVGDIAPYVTVEPATLRLYPGTTGTVRLTFAPPRGPDATAGPNPYAVRITPTEHPEATTVPEGNLTITPFTELRAELVPPIVRGRFRGRPRLALDNLGNTKLTASIGGKDNGDQVSFDIRPSNVQIDPGRAAFVDATLRPRRIMWFGSKERRPYSLLVQRSGRTPGSVDGTYVQLGVLPRWLATLFSLLAALAVTCVALWFAYAPKVQSDAHEKNAQAASTVLPAPASNNNPAPAQSAPPAATTQQSPARSGGGSGGGGGSQPSKPTQTQPSDPGYPNVLLLNGTTNKCASLTNPGTSGANIVQYPCDSSGTHQQVWNIEVVAKGKAPNGGDLYQIRNVTDDYCMGEPGTGAAPLSTPVSEYSCDRTTDSNQLWWLDKQASTGYYWVRNYASSGLCLDVSGYASDGTDAADGKNLTLYNCSNTDDQGWVIKQS